MSRPDLPSMLLGAAYYPEYQPTPDLGRDLDLMRAAGFRVIRVGESVWSTWEPRDGQFELDWLEPVIDAAQARGIGVVLGTPTYAIPPWLQLSHPGIAAERRTGEPVPWGIRQEIDHTNPDYLRYAERIIRAVVGRYASHPGVIGYQLDNEPGQVLPHNEAVFRRFVRELELEHGTLERLNGEWGLTHWSHRLTSWDEMWRPEGTLSPQYHLAWRRFQARLVNEFIEWQAAIVREYARPDQFLTTCIDYARPGVDDPALAKRLDIASANIYVAMQDGLDETTDGGLIWPPSGTWGVYYAADRAWATRQQSFLVTETNATSIGGASINRPAFDGQWQQVGWALIARGAASVQYWHWHTLHHGPETYWGGVLPHDEQPGRVYGQISQLGATMARAGAAFEGLVPDAQVGFLFSVPSKWALSFAPPLVGGDGLPDPLSYERIVSSVYRGFFRAGGQMRFLHAEGELPDAASTAATLPVLVAAGYYIAEDRVLDWLRRYVEAGGHLVLGPRTGYADPQAAARTERMPARLFDVAGVGYQEYSDLQVRVPVRAVAGSGLDLPDTAAATAWIDGLETTGADILASYAHPHFGRWATVTTTASGAGRVTTLGTVPDPSLATALARWVLQASGVTPWLQPRPGLHVTSARLHDGRRVRFLHAWSWSPAEAVAPTAVIDAASGERFAAGASVTLPPWGVRALIEEAGSQDR